jgi:hypothetical protein
LYSVVEFLLADGPLFCQRRIAGDVESRLAEIGLSPAEISHRLIEGCLVLAWVDREHELSCLDEGAFLIIPRLQGALDARADLRVYVALGRANPFEVDGNVLLNHLGHEDLGRR